MGDAPKARGFRATLGKSMNIAVEGIMPEIARNKANPDTANRTGQPWPDSVGSLFDRVNRNGSGTVSGTSDFFSVPLTLTSEGVWIVWLDSDLGGSGSVSLPPGGLIGVQVGIGYDGDTGPFDWVNAAATPDIPLVMPRRVSSPIFTSDDPHPADSGPLALAVFVNVTASGGASWSSKLITVRGTAVRFGDLPS